MKLFSLQKVSYCKILEPLILTNAAKIGRFYTRGRIICLDELGQTVVRLWVLCVSGINKGTKHVICVLNDGR